MLQILVAEDDDVLRTVIVEILEKEGYDVISVENGESAVNIVDETFDLLLFDWQLPCISGDEALRRIRHRFPSLPCILSSCQVKAKQIADAIVDTWFLQKPYNVDDLLLLVDKFRK